MSFALVFRTFSSTNVAFNCPKKCKMGSCVSHCSRQDIIHHQTGRVNTEAQKAIEIATGQSLLDKGLGIEPAVQHFAEEDKCNNRALSTRKSLASGNSHVTEINAEIRALRDQLVRSQVLFTYLLKDASSDNTPKSSEDKSELHALLEEGNLRDAIFQCKSFDGQVPPRLYNRSNRSSSSYASHRSTPMHCGYTSLSCPTLPIESPVVTKSTQTEPVFGVTFCLGSENGYSAESQHSFGKDAALYHSSTSSPCANNNEPLLLTEICDVHREPDEHTYPRHRTNSFLAAVKDGNPKLIDATSEICSSDITKVSLSSDITGKNHYANQFIHDAETNTAHSGPKLFDSDMKSAVDDTKECMFPRRLSILLEEDYEDASGNSFSVCSSQPFLSKKRKHSHSCSVNTQTDLSLSVDPKFSGKNYFPLTKSIQDFPLKEFCLPKHGYSIVTDAVQKKTVYSEKLPQKLVLRYPPPYTKKSNKFPRYISSGDNYFRELSSKHKSHMYKWATVAESLPSKSEYSQIMSRSHAESSLQTRHLSLEKQESFSSCDHSLYGDSRMSSITDCSGWLTKSEIELNQKPELPSYQQSVLAPHRNQLAKNRFENAGGEIKADSKQTEMSVARQVMSNHSTSVTESKNENYDKIMKSQRSMRRGSGAGSPNSQLSIPRCPAFDFSEQEDVQSLFPSPSEPEGYHNIKTDVHGTQIGETENDSLLSSSRLKDPSLKKRDSSKSKTLMPELMENSETESAKGSFECEAPDLPISVEAPSVPMPDIAFPSLPNTFLAKLGVHKDSPLPVEAFDEQELESKFIALSLAFKTDRTTLNKRLELHKRQRDMAEKNVENEFHAMREHLNALNLKATSSDIRDFISKILNHLDIAQQATSRVSGRSETFGAVQQEERVCRAFEVLVLHVDHLKRLFDKEHKELEETRKMLSDTQAFRKDFDGDSVSEDQKKYLKTFGLPVGSMKSAGRRGASAADFHQHSLPESFRTPNFSFSWTSDCAVQNVLRKPIVQISEN